MADTLLNVSLPSGVWVDLYSSTGIAVGTKIQVQNLSHNTVNLYSAATAPAGNYGNNIISRGEQAVNESGDNGAWALCKGSEGLVNVKVYI